MVDELKYAYKSSYTRISGSDPHCFKDGSFGTYDNVTRQQVAVMLAGALDNFSYFGWKLPYLCLIDRVILVIKLNWCNS